ncbi:hypothetical protein FOXYSP1_11482 [Fusarium oxysporum f. sp. phaseoli]
MQHSSLLRCHQGLFCVSRWVLAEIPTGGLTTVVLKLRGSRQMAVSDDHRSTNNCSPILQLSASSMFIIPIVYILYISLCCFHRLWASFPPTPN